MQFPLAIYFAILGTSLYYGQFIIAIGILVIGIIKILFGTIEIYNPFGYPASKARFYKVRINDELVTVDYDLNQRISIIPFLINFNNH